MSFQKGAKDNQGFVLLKGFAARDRNPLKMFLDRNNLFRHAFNVNVLPLVAIPQRLTYTPCAVQGTPLGPNTEPFAWSQIINRVLNAI